MSNLPNDMTVYPQEFKLNCVKIGYPEYDIMVIIGNTAVANLTGCNDDYSPCPQSVLLDGTYLIDRVRYTITITWDGDTFSNGSFSQSITGDQEYQCVVKVTDPPIRRHNVTIQSKQPYFNILNFIYCFSSSNCSS